jgi:hypothetical protein
LQGSDDIWVSLAQDRFDLAYARQTLAELQKEHLVYRSALLLVSALHSSKEPDVGTIRRCIATIVNNISEWPNQWEHERRLRTDGFSTGLWVAREPNWRFSEQNLEHLEIWMSRADSKREDSDHSGAYACMFLSPAHCAHLVICELVNAFAPLVYTWGDSPVEAPHWDIAAGIRPLLYYMLRREYLRAAGIGICRNFDCRQVFEIERSGQEFCGEECSRLQRQREYWSARGKKMRERRLRQLKRKSTDKRKEK